MRCIILPRPRSRVAFAAAKKRKLSLRDRISFIEDQITPDIIA